MNRTANKILRQSTFSSPGRRLGASISARSTYICRPMGNPRTPRPERLREHIALEASLSPVKPLGECFRDVFLDRRRRMMPVLRIYLGRRGFLDRALGPPASKRFLIAQSTTGGFSGMMGPAGKPLRRVGVGRSSATRISTVRTCRLPWGPGSPRFLAVVPLPCFPLSL